MLPFGDHRASGDETDAGTNQPVWLFRIAALFGAFVLGVAAAVGLASINWGLVMPGAVVGVVTLPFAIAFACRGKTRLGPWFWIGFAFGLLLGCGFLIWLLIAFAAAY